MSVQSSGSFTESWSDFAVKIFKWREDDVWSRAVAQHFGFPVAGLFAWQASYIRCLWVLACFGFIFALLEGSLSEDENDKVRPFFCLAILLFGAAVSEFENPEERIMAVARAAGLAPQADEGAEPLEAPIETAPRALWIKNRPMWVRWARTCVLVPLVSLQFLVIASVFVCVFWFEMYVIFEWGQCRRINDEHRAEHGEHSGFPCRSSDMYRGYWAAFVLESLPSITEGILFELLIGVSKSMAEFVCVQQQNWRTEQQYKFAFVIQVFLIEMVGKVGFMCVLAFSFTPNWGMYGDCMTSIDSLVFGSASLSCIKVGVPYELRKAMLRRAMRGPMMVSMLVGLTIKVLVPKLVTKMVWAARERPSEETRRGCCWPCKNCGRWLLRLLGLIFIFDCDAVGGLSFVKKRMMHISNDRTESRRTSWASTSSVTADDAVQEPPTRTISAASERDVALAALAQPQLLARTDIESALHEGLRKEFTVADEYLEVILHFTYFSFFWLVWPMGCLFALMNFLLEYRFDVAKLGQVRRRPVPKPDRNLRKLLKTVATIISAAAIPFNVLIMLLPFEVLVIWFPSHFTELVMEEEHDEHVYRQSLDLSDYVPYWVLTFFLSSLLLFACSYVLRQAILEVRRRDLKLRQRHGRN